MNLPSTKPYFIRAVYEWCVDNGFTPYLAVQLGPCTRVPLEFSKDGQIVLNISADATNKMKMGNEFIEFHARFGGVAREISVPISNVLAIYARENGEGMAFELDESTQVSPEASPSVVAPAATPLSAAKLPLSDSSNTTSGSEPEPPRPPAGSRPKLQRVK